MGTIPPMNAADAGATDAFLLMDAFLLTDTFLLMDAMASMDETIPGGTAIAADTVSADAVDAAPAE